MNADFWDMTWLRRRTRRIHLFHGVAGKYGLDAPVDLAPTIAAFDCLMFINDDRRQRYIDAGLVADDRLAAPLVGYPKLDCLVDGSLDRERHRAIARRSIRQLPTVLYAPTWSPHSSLNPMGEDVIERLAAEGLQVIVKLHDRSYDRRARGSGGIDWTARLSEVRHPSARSGSRSEPDGSPFMVASDAMVSDHSSIAFEYMLLDRPLVIIDRPDLIEHARINPEKVRQLRSAAAVVREPATRRAMRVASRFSSRTTVGGTRASRRRSLLQARNGDRSRADAPLPDSRSPDCLGSRRAVDSTANRARVAVG